jgi:hypothetical protein
MKALANQSNAPISYTLDGKQYVLLAAGDTLYALTLPKAAPSAQSPAAQLTAAK